MKLFEENRWPHVPTEHPCPTCGFPLNRVWPSRMVVCDNPACDNDPLFLVRGDQ